MAPARGSGDSIEVTYKVARTRITIALSVVATIMSVVRMERMNCFMVGTPAGVSSKPKHNELAGKAEFGQAASTASPTRQESNDEKSKKRCGPKQNLLAQAGPLD